jgi:hypothetical protein
MDARWYRITGRCRSAFRAWTLPGVDRCLASSASDSKPRCSTRLRRGWRERFLCPARLRARHREPSRHLWVRRSVQFFDGQERRDLYDLVEWAAEQPWSDGNIGMVGISYFACTQMEAAVERPPHLNAIMPIAGTFDLYESATHHGLFSSSFVTPFLSMIGMTSGRSDKFWRSQLLEAATKMLLTPAIHKSSPP